MYLALSINMFYSYILWPYAHSYFPSSLHITPSHVISLNLHIGSTTRNDDMQLLLYVWLKRVRIHTLACKSATYNDMHIWGCSWLGFFASNFMATSWHVSRAAPAAILRPRYSMMIVNRRPLSRRCRLHYSIKFMVSRRRARRHGASIDHYHGKDKQREKLHRAAGTLEVV